MPSRHTSRPLGWGLILVGIGFIFLLTTAFFPGALAVK